MLTCREKIESNEAKCINGAFRRFLRLIMIDDSYGFR